MSLACLVLALSACTGTPAQSGYCLDKPESVVNSPILAVASLNIGHGRKDSVNQWFVSKRQTYQNLDDIADLLNDTRADVVALQEADAVSRWSGNFDHVEYLVDQMRFACYFHGQHQQGSMATFGTALLTDASMQRSKSIAFPPSPPSTNKGYVRSRIRWQQGGIVKDVTVVSAHLDFLRKSVRAAQVREMIDDLSALSTPIVIMGDLNSSWADERSAVRMLVEALDLVAYMPEDENIGTYKKLTGKRLDWILISKPLKFVEYRVLTTEVSDHLAIHARIGWQE